jgi:hypothetical protein
MNPEIDNGHICGYNGTPRGITKRDTRDWREERDWVGVQSEQVAPFARV